MAICAAVFDLDGTICDTLGDIGASMNRAFASVGIPTRPVEEYARFIGGGIRNAFQQAAPQGTTEEVREKALAFYLADYPEHCADSTEPYPGLRQLLLELTARNIRLAVVTNKTETTAQRLISAILPDVPFSFVWGRKDGRPLKPDPALGDDVCRELSLSPEEILFVGDGDADMLFAANAGFKGVAVTWGYRSVEQLREAGAENFADTAEEVLNYV